MSVDTRRCACGGSISVLRDCEPRQIEAAVRVHNEGESHVAWRARGGLDVEKRRLVRVLDEVDAYERRVMA